jgi:hypothetical protein
MRVNLRRSSCSARLLIIFLSVPFVAVSQDEDRGSVHGNFQIDAQYYREDSLIGAPHVPEKLLSNGFGIINYSKGKFTAGLRYEAYNNVMQGFDQKYVGQGITNRFVRYQDKLVDVTAGHIYEQFGSGLILRTYYEPGLLYDNALDGFRVISNPYHGLTFKGLVGRQRSYFTLGPGIVRGFDGEVNFNELFDSSMRAVKTKFILGGSFVSKYQPDENPDFILPENVGSYSGRVNFIHESFNIFAEYAYKENDPSLANSSVVNGKTYYSYKPGEALFISASFAGKGISLLLQGKRIDNMSYRSDRNAVLQNVLINYLPATTRQHTYLMPAYSPYATQPTGEVGGMAELQFKLKKGTSLGGKYGTEVTINYSHANALKQRNVRDSLTHSTLYITDYDKAGVDLYHDFFIEVNKKFSKQWKATFMYANQFNNINIVQHNTPKGPYGNVKSHIGVLDLTWKYAGNAALRAEAQIMLRNNSDTLNLGSWGVALLEWTPNTHFFLAAIDQYNYGNPVSDLRLHYPLITAGYTEGAHRISVSYGKQRAGIFCIGGVCRTVPASNGFAISITSSF